MSIREELEALERQTLSPYAALSADSQGRDRPEPQDDIRPVYERDRDRIIHCKAFRRLKHKTQVFIAPEETTIVPVSPIPWRSVRSPAPSPRRCG